MANTFFRFKQFTVHQERSAMKVTTDSCLFGAWVADKLSNENRKPGQLADIGTGTGLLSLMILQKNPGILIDAVEIDPGAAAQAKENSEASPWKEAITVTCADIKDFAKEKSSFYNSLVCNPPFYENELASPDQGRHTAHHSAALTLNELIPITGNLLTERGQLFLLLSHKRLPEAEILLGNSGFCITDLVLVRQTTAHAYFRVMIAAERNVNTGDNKRNSSEIAIKDIQGNYTTEFISLLKDYYLYL